MTWQEVIDQFGVPEWDTDPDRLIAPGGESWTGFVARAGAAVQALAERHPGELVVAAVHAGVIEATMIDFLDIPPLASRRGWARILHASVTEWEWVAGALPVGAHPVQRRVRGPFGLSARRKRPGPVRP